MNQNTDVMVCKTGAQRFEDEIVDIHDLLHYP